MGIDYETLLNKDQLRAVTTLSQHVRIIAGAGSGKTRVLTYRVAYLINDLHVEPSSIMAVTFTNKAANEMKERIEKLVPGTQQFLQVSTFHSFCARFLRKEAYLIGYPNSFTILDDDDSDKMIVDILVEMGYKKKDPFMKTVKNYIGHKKMLGILPEQITLSAKRLFKDEDKALEAYMKYEAEKYQMLALDFDDLQIKTLQILTDFPDVRAKWSRRYNYLLVDEFQDTNDVQYKLLTLLCTPDTYLYVVGDPDQTIYTWRGANQKLILDFPRNFPDFEDIVLDRNYRSTKNILDSANRLIAFNKKRVPKNLYTVDQEGDPVLGKVFESAEEEARWLATQVLAVAGPGRDFSNIAILYRASYVTRAIESAFARNNIPYRLFGGLRFYQRKEVKDVLCYFRLFVNEKDDVAFDRIVNVPRRGIGESSQNLLKEEASALGLSQYEYAKNIEHYDSALPGRVIVALQALTSQMEQTKARINDSTTGEVYSKVLKDFIKDIKYYEFIAEDQAIDEDRAENVNALFDDLNTFISENPQAPFEEYLQNISLLTSQDDMNGGNYVSMMTIHVAKGLEFDDVFVVSMNQGVFPSQRALDDPTRGENSDPMEEERRLAYVAITRAKKKLFLSSHSGYSYVTDSRSIPSQFFKESGTAVKGSFNSSAGGGYSYRGQGSSWGKTSYGGGSYGNSFGMGQKKVTRNAFGDEEHDAFDDFDQRPQKKKEAPTVFGEQPTTNGVDHWKIGDRVSHLKFGEGKVIQIINDAVIVVEFETSGKKTLAAHHASLTRLHSEGGEA